MTSKRDQLSPDTKVDLTNCEREPIHILGNVQGYGCLISTSLDLMVNHMSLNCKEMLGLDPEIAVGQRLIGLLPEQTTHDLRSKLQVSSFGGEVSRLFSYDVLNDGKQFDISIHQSGESFVFEFEPKRNDPMRDDLSMVQPLLARVKRHSEVKAVAQEAARAIQIMSDFDRVMVYQFAADQSGEVIAEVCRSDMEPFLGLRYPASDIPKQARELYKRSTLRLIADVDGDVSPITPQTNPKGEPLDLSLAATRAVSPIHLEYLRNMGVASSMSVSILKNGELWGLFACHHSKPHYVDYERRTAIELFAQFFSYELSQKIEVILRDDERRSRELHDRLMVRLSSGGDLIENFDSIAEELAQIIPSDGIAVLTDGEYSARGAAPNREEFASLARFLNTAPPGEVYQTDSIVSVYPQAEIFGDRVAGILAVPISRTPRDFIVFFRREIARTVRWGGNPEKPVEVGPNGIRLTPRKSFEAWTELKRDTSEPWGESEIHAAESLRLSLIEIVLKLTDEASLERKSAAEKQELLIAELNHRVRNILNLVQGLVSQSKADATDIASYTKVLDGRIQSLARAHDQLTRQEWAPCSLRDLIDVEIAAYLNDQKDRLIVSGDVPLLEPDAFSTMALVIHELATNAAKYGGLTDQSGKVEIDLRIDEFGALLIKWRERGGPAVKPPKRRGFGTLIIERSVPFELKGTVETNYRVTGFEAEIMLPAHWITRGTIAEKVTKSAEEKAADDARLSGTALVLEDNMVIALDASDILTQAGASDVIMNSNVHDALATIADKEISFAVLDVNLGDTTSLAVAEELDRLGLPFVMATGYGEAEAIVKDFPKAPIVMKPFNTDSLTTKIKQAMAMRSK